MCVPSHFVTIGSCNNGPSQSRRHDCDKLRRGAQPDLRLTWQQAAGQAAPEHIRVSAASHLVD